MKHSNFLSFIKKGALVSTLLFTGSASLSYQNLSSIDDPSSSNQLSLELTSEIYEQNDTHVSKLNPNAESYIPSLIWKNKVAEINNKIYQHLDEMYQVISKNNSKFVKNITAHDVESGNIDGQIIARNKLFSTLQSEVYFGSYHTLMKFLSNSYSSYMDDKETLTESDEKIYNTIEIIWHDFEKIFCLYVINKSIKLSEFYGRFNCYNILYILPKDIKSLFSTHTEQHHTSKKGSTEKFILTSTILENVRNNPASMAKLLDSINQ